MLIYTTRDQYSADTGEKIVIGRVLTRGRTKICFRRQLPLGNRLCPSERRSGIPAISTYRKVWPPSTLGRSVCGYMEAAPFALLGFFEIIKSRPMLLPLNPSCSEALSASLGKKNYRDRIPRDTLDSFPGRRNRGDQNARDTFYSFPGKMHRADQTP